LHRTRQFETEKIIKMSQTMPKNRKKSKKIEIFQTIQNQQNTLQMVENASKNTSEVKRVLKNDI